MRCEMRLSGFLVLSKNCAGLLGVCPICRVEEIADRLIGIRLTRISYLDMLLAVVTQYTMFQIVLKVAVL